jgi:hypothetical protein
MSENTIESENINKPAPDTAKPKGERKAKKAKPAKKAGRAKEVASKPKADRSLLAAFCRVNKKGTPSANCPNPQSNFASMA